MYGASAPNSLFVRGIGVYYREVPGPRLASAVARGGGVEGVVQQTLVTGVRACVVVVVVVVVAVVVTVVVVYTCVTNARACVCACMFI